MAKFSAMNPRDVRVGRGMAADRARAPYRTALLTMGAGRIELERGDKPTTVKRLLQDTSKLLGIRVRSSWEDSNQRALLWKRVGEVTAAESPGPLEREWIGSFGEQATGDAILTRQLSGVAD